MFLLSEPTENIIRNFFADQQNENFSYSEIGASRSTNAPFGYNVDHNRIQLGIGRKDFEKAVEAIENWKMFDISWIKIFPPRPSLEIGQNVVVAIRHFGFWSLNANRIVYTLDEKGETEKYGFAYGTLPEHGECGEERFSVEFNHQTQEVWYDLFAFSKPNHILAKIGYPLSRHLQKHFAAESKNAMLLAVTSHNTAQN